LAIIDRRFLSRVQKKENRGGKSNAQAHLAKESRASGRFF
jgi:hypothetical protein